MIKTEKDVPVEFEVAICIGETNRPKEHPLSIEVCQVLPTKSISKIYFESVIANLGDTWPGRKF